VAERAPCPAAGSAARHVFGKRTGLTDVLGADPDGVTVHSRASVVTLTGITGNGPESFVPGQAVFRAHSFSCNMNLTGAGKSVQSGVSGARIMICARQSERDNRFAFGGDAY